MLRNLGRLIWKQSREISVLNYPHHIVYEIYTGQGFKYFVVDKTSEKVDEFSRLVTEGKKDVVIRDECVPNLR